MLDWKTARFCAEFRCHSGSAQGATLCARITAGQPVIEHADASIGVNLKSFVKAGLSTTVFCPEQTAGPDAFGWLREANGNVRIWTCQFKLMDKPVTGDKAASALLSTSLQYLYYTTDRAHVNQQYAKRRTEVLWQLTKRTFHKSGSLRIIFAFPGIDLSYRVDANGDIVLVVDPTRAASEFADLWKFLKSLKFDI